MEFAECECLCEVWLELVDCVPNVRPILGDKMLNNLFSLASHEDAVALVNYSQTSSDPEEPLWHQSRRDAEGSGKDAGFLLT